MPLVPVGIADRQFFELAPRAEDLRRALDLAMPDKGSRVEYAIVTTDDGGWARLMRPARWISDATVRAALATHHAEALGGSDWEAGAGPSSERTP